MKFPFAAVEFESDGSVHDEAQVKAARDVVDGADDVLVLVHGWNNDMPAARSLYERLTDNVDAVRDRVPGAAGRKIAVIGVLWPSVTWADEDDVAGGGAGAADAADALVTEIGHRDLDPGVAAELQQLVPKLDTSADARQKYLNILRTQLPDDVTAGEDAPPLAFLKGDADTAFERAGRAGGLAGAGRAGGGAAGVSIGGFLRAARNLLNLTTYYTMRDRAGTVGANGIARLLEQLQGDGRRIHLVGHSFGARAVSAAANATNAPVHSLVLLQGAFSHFGFADNWNGEGADGLFRAVPSRIRGPMVVTHTKNDKAVGLAYAIASRLARQVAVDIGGPNDNYGGIGRNGALKSPEALPQGTLLPVGGDYAFEPRRISNLQADAFVSGHSAVTGGEVAYALLTAMVSPGA
jgi:pimeloyl-ACP methyl ester carboxylesterase